MLWDCNCRSNHRVSSVILAVLLLAPSSFGWQARVHGLHEPIHARVATSLPLPAGVPGSMVGGLWMIDSNFKSAVYIKNGVETSEVTVSPVLYVSNGTTYFLPDIVLKPSGTAVLDIGLSLEQLGIAPYATLSGYIELKYNWPRGSDLCHHPQS